MGIAGDADAEHGAAALRRLAHDRHAHLARAFFAGGNGDQVRRAAVGGDVCAGHALGRAEHQLELLLAFCARVVHDVDFNLQLRGADGEAERHIAFRNPVIGAVEAVGAEGGADVFMAPRHRHRGGVRAAGQAHGEALRAAPLVIGAALADIAGALQRNDNRVVVRNIQRCAVPARVELAAVLIGLGGGDLQDQALIRLVPIIAGDGDGDIALPFARRNYQGIAEFVVRNFIGVGRAATALAEGQREISLALAGQSDAEHHLRLAAARALCDGLVFGLDAVGDGIAGGDDGLRAPHPDGNPRSSGPAALRIHQGKQQRLRRFVQIVVQNGDADALRAIPIAGAEGERASRGGAVIRFLDAADLPFHRGVLGRALPHMAHQLHGEGDAPALLGIEMVHAHHEVAGRCAVGGDLHLGDASSIRAGFFDLAAFGSGIAQDHHQRFVVVLLQAILDNLDGNGSPLHTHRNAQNSLFAALAVEVSHGSGGVAVIAACQVFGVSHGVGNLHIPGRSRVEQGDGEAGNVALVHLHARHAGVVVAAGVRNNADEDGVGVGNGEGRAGGIAGRNLACASVLFNCIGVERHHDGLIRLVQRVVGEGNADVAAVLPGGNGEDGRAAGGGDGVVGGILRGARAAHHKGHAQRPRAAPACAREGDAEGRFAVVFAGLFRHRGNGVGERIAGVDGDRRVGIVATDRGAARPAAAGIAQRKQQILRALVQLIGGKGDGELVRRGRNSIRRLFEGIGEGDGLRGAAAPIAVVHAADGPIHRGGCGGQHPAAPIHLEGDCVALVCHAAHCAAHHIYSDEAVNGGAGIHRRLRRVHGRVHRNRAAAAHDGSRVQSHAEGLFAFPQAVLGRGEGEIGAGAASGYAHLAACALVVREAVVHAVRAAELGRAAAVCAIWAVCLHEHYRAPRQRHRGGVCDVERHAEGYRRALVHIARADAGEGRRCVLVRRNRRGCAADAEARRNAAAPAAGRLQLHAQRLLRLAQVVVQRADGNVAVGVAGCNYKLAAVAAHGGGDAAGAFDLVIAALNSRAAQCKGRAQRFGGRAALHRNAEHRVAGCAGRALAEAVHILPRNVQSEPVICGNGDFGAVAGRRGLRRASPRQGNCAQRQGQRLFALGAVVVGNGDGAARLSRLRFRQGEIEAARERARAHILGGNAAAAQRVFHLQSGGGRALHAQGEDRRAALFGLAVAADAEAEIVVVGDGEGHPGVCSGDEFAVAAIVSAGCADFEHDGLIRLVQVVVVDDQLHLCLQCAGDIVRAGIVRVGFAEAEIPAQLKISGGVVGGGAPVGADECVHRELGQPALAAAGCAREPEEDGCRAVGFVNARLRRGEREGDGVAAEDTQRGLFIAEFGVAAASSRLAENHLQSFRTLVQIIVKNVEHQILRGIPVVRGEGECSGPRRSGPVLVLQVASHSPLHRGIAARRVAAQADAEGGRVALVHLDAVVQRIPVFGAHDGDVEGALGGIVGGNLHRCLLHCRIAAERDRARAAAGCDCAQSHFQGFGGLCFPVQADGNFKFYLGNARTQLKAGAQPQNVQVAFGDSRSSHRIGNGDYPRRTGGGARELNEEAGGLPLQHLHPRRAAVGIGGGVRNGNGNGDGIALGNLHFGLAAPAVHADRADGGGGPVENDGQRLRRFILRVVRGGDGEIHRGLAARNRELSPRRPTGKLEIAGAHAAYEEVNRHIPGRLLVQGHAEGGCFAFGNGSAGGAGNAEIRAGVGDAEVFAVVRGLHHWRFAAAARGALQADVEILRRLQLVVGFGADADFAAGFARGNCEGAGNGVCPGGGIHPRAACAQVLRLRRIRSAARNAEIHHQVCSGFAAHNGDAELRRGVALGNISALALLARQANAERFVVLDGEGGRGAIRRGRRNYPRAALRGAGCAERNHHGFILLAQFVALDGDDDLLRLRRTGESERACADCVIAGGSGGAGIGDGEGQGNFAALAAVLCAGDADIEALLLCAGAGPFHHALVGADFVLDGIAGGNFRLGADAFQGNAGAADAAAHGSAQRQRQRLRALVQPVGVHEHRNGLRGLPVRGAEAQRAGHRSLNFIVLVGNAADGPGHRCAAVRRLPGQADAEGDDVALVHLHAVRFRIPVRCFCIGHGGGEIAHRVGVGGNHHRGALLARNTAARNDAAARRHAGGAAESHRQRLVGLPALILERCDGNCRAGGIGGNHQRAAQAVGVIGNHVRATGVVADIAAHGVGNCHRRRRAGGCAVQGDAEHGGFALIHLHAAGVGIGINALIGDLHGDGIVVGEIGSGLLGGAQRNAARGGRRVAEGDGEGLRRLVQRIVRGGDADFARERGAVGGGGVARQPGNGERACGGAVIAALHTAAANAEGNAGIGGELCTAHGDGEARRLCRVRSTLGEAVGIGIPGDGDRHRIVVGNADGVGDSACGEHRAGGAAAIYGEHHMEGLLCFQQ